MADEIVGGQSSPSPAPAAPATPSGPSAPAPAPTYPIKWNGQEHQLSLEDLQAHAQKGFDYTQKLQRLAAERKAFEARQAQVEQVLQQVHGFLSDRERLAQYYQQQFGMSLPQARQAAAEQDLEDPSAQFVNKAELAQYIQSLNQQQQQQLLQQVQQAKAELKVDALAQEYRNALYGRIGQLTNQMPELKAIPRVRQLIIDEVREASPESIEKALELAQDVAQRYAMRQRQFAQQQVKQNPVATPLRGIEPPGGQGAIAPPSSPFKKVDDPRLRAAVMQDLTRILGQGHS